MLSSYLFTIIVTNYGICHTHAMDVSQKSMQPFLIELICIDDSCIWHMKKATPLFNLMMVTTKTNRQITLLEGSQYSNQVQ
jgi:hypothetical protein